MRYIFGVLGVILLLLLLVVFVFNRGGDNTPADNKAKVSLLTDYADKDSNVSMTIWGKMVGDEEHNAIRINITATERTLEILNGYDENVVSTQTYPNTEDAYSAFLSALAGQGFLNSKKSSVTDRWSACPSGRHYIYDLSEDDEHVSNLWSVSCDNTGTFNGKGGMIRKLFQNQIPDYSKQVTAIKV